MKIAVIGAGAIGSLVAGYLKNAGEDVSLVGHADAVSVISKKGLSISGARGDFNIKIASSEVLRERPDLAILAVKTQDLEEALRANAKFLDGAIILTAQNGVRADIIVSQLLAKGNIISSIVMFGATYLEPGKVVHNFDRSWVIGRPLGSNDEKVLTVRDVLTKAFYIVISDDMRGMKYLKVFVNSNNCLPAILGASMQEAFADTDICKISIAIWKEGLAITDKASVQLSSLPEFPVDNVMKLTSLPIEEAARIFSGIMTSLSKEPLYGSILQSIKRGRSSEIDYINGEFVRLAKENGLSAPLNEKLVDMVHTVERTGRFFSKEQLLSHVDTYLNLT
jgi:2-dehydropantoate 2-reductase